MTKSLLAVATALLLLGSAGTATAQTHRDRDHDGVPNRYDHRPDNPYRR